MSTRLMDSGLLVGGGTMWGISGPTFLGWYLAVSAATAVAAALSWYRSVSRPAGAGAILTLNDQTDPYLAGYLNGGGKLALLTAVVSLHRAGRLRVGNRGFERVGVPPGRSGPVLEQAVLAEAVDPRSFEQLSDAPRVLGALGQLREELVLHRLLLADVQRARLRYRSYALLAVLLIGLARLAGDTAEGNPVGELLLCVVPLGVLTIVLLVGAPVRTVLGRWTVSMLRTKYGYLAPSTRPDWDAHGTLGAALGVAVFGASTLRAIAPELAAETVAADAVGVGGEPGGAR